MKSSRYSYQILITVDSCRQSFEKYSNINFYEFLSCGSQFVPCGRTDVTKLIIGFRDFANAPNDGRMLCEIWGSQSGGSVGLYCRVARRDGGQCRGCVPRFYQTLRHHIQKTVFFRKIMDFAPAMEVHFCTIVFQLSTNVLQ